MGEESGGKIAVDSEDGWLFYGEEEDMNVMGVKAVDQDGEMVEASYVGIDEVGNLFKPQDNEGVLPGAKNLLEELGLWSEEMVQETAVNQFVVQAILEE